VPIDPVVDRLQTISNPAHCNGCDTAMAAKLGADYALTGEVRKISNLILSLELNLRDADTGTTLRAGTVDIRGNTDESWQRGFSYLLRNLIFRKD
jgi:TolB-like protein